MLRTFNCGIGMIVVASADQADDVMQRLSRAGESPVRIGETITHAGGEPVQTSGRLKI
jgi:phosphoribosylformylglycinamidine cyclo-ligase